MTGVEVQRVHAAGWRELRELRLRALADAPEAFASTLDREAAFGDGIWRQRAQGGPASASFLARAGGVGVGMAAVVAPDDARAVEDLVCRAVHGLSGRLVHDPEEEDLALRRRRDRRRRRLRLRRRGRGGRAPRDAKAARAPAERLDHRGNIVQAKVNPALYLSAP